MYKLRLPQREGTWSVCLTLVGACGKVIGTPASISFLSKPSAVSLTSQKSRGNPSARPSCVHTDAGHSTNAGSMCSNTSDSDHDYEAEVFIAHQRIM
mmetsp:Transcript_39633/g.94870  ORF Transcript_39633/g.94870 Transcript_39633/m.94870 type:complete len:97 (+) Transcript_39633:1-291(+)